MIITNTCQHPVGHWLCTDRIAMRRQSNQAPWPIVTFLPFAVVTTLLNYMILFKLGQTTPRDVAVEILQQKEGVTTFVSSPELLV